MSTRILFSILFGLFVAAFGCTEVEATPAMESGEAMSKTLVSARLDALRVVDDFEGLNQKLTGIDSWAVDLYATETPLALKNEQGTPLVDEDGRAILLKSAETMIGFRKGQKGGTPEAVVTFEVWSTVHQGIVLRPLEYRSEQEQERFRSSAQRTKAIQDDIDALRQEVARRVAETKPKGDGELCEAAAVNAFFAIATLTATISLTVVGRAATGVIAVGFCGWSIYSIAESLPTKLGEIAEGGRVLARCHTRVCRTRAGTPCS
jgi:hypothetical protein